MLIGTKSPVFGARVLLHCEHMAQPFVVLAALAMNALAAGLAASAELADGTAVSMRLLRPINSETSRAGDPLEFVVTKDVMSGGQIVISRGTKVAGVLVKVKRAHWGFSGDHRPTLAFRFYQMVADDGSFIRLRASADRREKDRALVDRFGRHHQLQWAGEADIFDAYVDGNHVGQGPGSATEGVGPR